MEEKFLKPLTDDSLLNYLDKERDKFFFMPDYFSGRFVFIDLETQLSNMKDYRKYVDKFISSLNKKWGDIEYCFWPEIESKNQNIFIKVHIGLTNIDDPFIFKDDLNCLQSIKRLILNQFENSKITQINFKNDVNIIYETLNDLCNDCIFGNEYIDMYDKDNFLIYSESFLI